MSAMDEPVRYQLRDIIEDFATAWMILLRVPCFLPETYLASPKPARSVWVFPLIGGVIGLIGGLAFGLAHWLGLSDAVAGGFALVAMMIATGGLHEDGLADVADGCGGNTQEIRLKIMADSRIGTYGTLSLIMAVGLKWLAVTQIATALGTSGILTALVAIGALSRGAILLALFLLPPARKQGLGNSVAEPVFYSVAAGLVLAAITALFLLPSATALTLFAIAVLTVFGVSAMARQLLGGQTGDVLGAVQQLSELALLTAVLAFL